MSDTNAQEPTMEEILASIRRIISEDDAPAAAAPAAEAEAEPEPSAAHDAPPEAAPEPSIQSFDEDDDDVLDLTEPAPPLPAPKPEPVAAAPGPVEALGDLEVAPRPAPTPASAPAPPPYRPAPVAVDDRPDEGLISHPNADLAATAFGQLSRTLAMPTEQRTLEDVVRELLRPMLKDWLDSNLSGIVETAVQAEVERISRLRRF